LSYRDTISYEPRQCVFANKLCARKQHSERSNTILF